MPPPSQSEKNIGEKRIVNYTVYIYEDIYEDIKIFLFRALASHWVKKLMFRTPESGLKT